MRACGICCCQAEDGRRESGAARGIGEGYKRQGYRSGKESKITEEDQWKKGWIRIHIPKVSVDEKVEIVFEQKLTLNDNHTLERGEDLLNQAQDSNLAKESAYRL